MTKADILAGYIRYFETLTPQSVGKLRGLAIAEMEFADPFNHVHTRDQVEAIFNKMFREVDDPKFIVTDQSISDNTGHAYLKWDFSFIMRGKPVTVIGMSEIRFAPDGKIAAHIDHWDSGRQFYARLPILGAIIRWVQRKLGV